MPQGAENIKKNIKANLTNFGSILNLGNARLGYSDHSGQLTLRQAESFSALYDFFDELVFLA